MFNYKKRGVIEFSWIFALIVGAVILFLAFYFIGTKITESNLAKKAVNENNFDIILNPFSYFGGLGATSAKTIEMTSEQKINFSCSTESIFGYDSILDSTKALMQPAKTIYDKYLFSESYLEGKNFQIISKPWNKPWRVGDVIYIISKDVGYCFIDMRDVEDEFGESATGLNISNFYFVDSAHIRDCNNSLKICSTSLSYACDIRIGPDYVYKNGMSNKKMYFTDEAMMYAAIFSDYDIYNCNFKRLAARLETQTDIYNDKMKSLNSRQCNLAINLAPLKDAAQKIADNPAIITENHIQQLNQAASSIAEQNTFGTCTLF